MSQTTSPISGVALRYASSLFELAQNEGNADQVEQDLVGLGQLIAESDDLSRLIKSPVFAADEQEAALVAIADKAAMAPLTKNFLRVVASNRRLFVLPGMIAAYKEIAADARGEVTAKVVAAHDLTDQQRAELSETLKDVAGKDVAIDLSVDPSLLGGLVVQIGSRQIDTSLKTKLNSMKLALKEVG
ncbi:F0F1 ATP synthase subunit delta [Notoacmeibacter ruber]|uniref:ATP synthase subunit delta n=1 Tax=Notoacmeibacter ruber TaxID=2670375 RepID=A0A3L7JE49_9HYPH|nr:F0F1 ATP synthase subunit delta [Notoacmeibacter ruber]RLQ88956.1 F0F1 ATP synthase subunit delta [Notoacmeibacter ruber]